VTHTVVGVLALQGDFREHREAFARLDVETVEVRKPGHLASVNALVIPGGESTAISKLLTSSQLFEPIEQRLVDEELAVFGTCAGAILSAREVLDGIPEQRSFRIFDASVRRNGIGPQRFSHEVELEIDGLDEKFVTVFIRPPVIEETGPTVEVLATHQGKPVLCAQGPHMFATFHPELTADDRIHRLFLERVGRMYA